MSGNRGSSRQMVAIAAALWLGFAVLVFGQTVLPVTPDAGAAIHSLSQPDPHLYRSEEARQIRANGVQEFPGVPPGAVFGAQASNGARQWPPFTIVYPYGPVFEYRLF